MRFRFFAWELLAMCVETRTKSCENVQIRFRIRCVASAQFSIRVQILCCADFRLNLSAQGMVLAIFKVFLAVKRKVLACVMIHSRTKFLSLREGMDLSPIDKQALWFSQILSLGANGSFHNEKIFLTRKFWSALAEKSLFMRKNWALHIERAFFSCFFRVWCKFISKSFAISKIRLKFALLFRVDIVC